MPPASLRAISTIFLDRDGTINVKPAEGEYITSPAGLVLLPGAAGAVAKANAAGLRIVLVTNQRWLSGPAGDPARYAAVHARLEELLAAEGAWLDAAYHCPHAAAACDCRKPGPGMLQRAAREYPIELDQAVIIGDSDSDLMAGRAAGPRLSCSVPAQRVRLRTPTPWPTTSAAPYALSCRLRTLPGDPVKPRPGQQPDRERQIVAQVPAGQAAWLESQPVHPLQAQALHQRGGPAGYPRGHRDAAAAGEVPGARPGQP